MRVLAAIGITLALAATDIVAGDLEDGAKFLKNKDYARAASSFRKAAEQGDAKAQVSLGSMYADGKGLARDYKQAVFWFQKATAQGDSSAQLNLGFMYEGGLGVAKDYKQAAFWYEKSAAQGNSIAMFSLYSLYSEGAVKDNVEAHK
jgi:TPR repeat protein